MATGGTEHVFREDIQGEQPLASERSSRGSHWENSHQDSGDTSVPSLSDNQRSHSIIKLVTGRGERKTTCGTETQVLVTQGLVSVSSSHGGFMLFKNKISS